MAEINDLSELTTGVVTDEMLYGLQSRLLVKMHNLLNGTQDLFDYRENGDAGFEVRPSFLLEQLRKALESVNKMIADPASRGDFAMVISQWDNPDL